MKTKIEYSIELQDVPKELKKKFEELSEKLAALSHYVEAMSQDLEYDNIGTVTSRIDRTRRRLLQVDNGLDDCDKTMRDYGDTIRELQKQQAAATASSEEGANDA
tara:strand:+ start:96 stop:410 length:315 start_codon:yes stop_codon:yes gene_type:complete